MSNLIDTIHSLVLVVILADSESASKADKLPSPPIPPFLQDFFSSNPFFAWVFWLFSALAIGIAAVAALTGNLQKIIDFCQKNLLRKKSEVSTEQLSKLRGQLLERLKSDISTRRKNSLHNLVQIDLHLEEQRHQVGEKTLELIPPDRENNNLLNRVFRRFNRSERELTQLRPNQKTIEFFDREDVRGKLLILGEPGAGKTTELLSLSEDLIQRAIDDENASIPIIFELSTWKNDRTIRDWLVERLTYTYKGIPSSVAEHWIDNQQLIPLLDGLDELGLERQNKCIDALNQFLDSDFQPGLVVCCRREEYEQAENKLDKLNGAIYLQSLTDEQIQQYLQSLNRSRIWNETVVNEPDLQKLVRKPLFLNMLVIAYQGRAIKSYSELFASYIQKQLDNPDNQGTYPPHKSPSPQQTLHYLVWLAKKLEVEKKTEFLIEEMQPTWLESANQKVVYRVICELIVGLSGGIMSGLIVGLSEGIMSGLIVGLSGGIMFGLSRGMTRGVNGGLIEVEIGSKIEPVDKLSFSLKKFARGLSGGLIFGLILGLIVRLIGGQSVGLMGGLSVGLMGGLFYVLDVVLSVVLSDLKTENKNIPNQGIWNSLRNGLSGGLIFGLILGLSGILIFGLIFGLSGGLIFGLILGLVFGLKAVIEHFILRLILYRNGYIPWNYALFLDHAVNHKFIQRVGGRYRFMHDLLREHFAGMPLS